MLPDEGDVHMTQVRVVGRRVSVLDLTHESLREAIVTLQLTPSETVTEEKLTRDLGVSRPILREAVQRLHTEGLLQRQSNGRLRVSPVSVDEVHHLYAVRTALERLAVTEAAGKADDEHQQLLEVAVDQFRRDAEKDDLGVVRSGGRIHRLLFDIADNSVNSALMDILRPRIDRYRHISVASARERPRRSLKELERFLAAFSRGDALAAADAMAAHIVQSERSAVAALREGVSDVEVAEPTTWGAAHPSSSRSGGRSDRNT